MRGCGLEKDSTFPGAVVAEDDPFRVSSREPPALLGEQQVQQEQFIEALMMVLVPPGEFLKHKDKHIIFKYSHGHAEACLVPAAVPAELQRNTESLPIHGLLLMLTEATPLGVGEETLYLLT